MTGAREESHERERRRAVTSTRNSVCNRGAAILGGHARIRAGILDSRCAVAALLAVTNVPKSAFARLNPINNLEVGCHPISGSVTKINRMGSRRIQHSLDTE